jgi:hypothetical protein
MIKFVNFDTKPTVTMEQQQQLFASIRQWSHVAECDRLFPGAEEDEYYRRDGLHYLCFVRLTVPGGTYEALREKLLALPEVKSVEVDDDEVVHVPLEND